MIKPFASAAIAAMIAYAGAAHSAPVGATPPLSEATLGHVKALFHQLMVSANKHDVAAIRRMFWGSPSAMIIAKSVDPAEGDWAAVWGTDAVTRKIQDIANSGPVTLTPDFDRLKAVAISGTVAETYAPMTIAVSYGGQNPAPRPFLMVVDWLKTPKGWKIASEIIIPVPVAPVKAG
jgi:hypothetical protein